MTKRPVDNSAAAHTSQRKTYYEKMSTMADFVSGLCAIAAAWVLFDLLSRPDGWVVVVILVAILLIGVATNQE